MWISTKIKIFITDIVCRIFSWLPLRVLTGKRYFRWWERRGIHITPVHFYMPIPEIRELEKRDIWKKKSDLVGIDMNVSGQKELLHSLCFEFSDELVSLYKKKEEVKGEDEYYIDNDFFGEVDAEILYGIIRKFKPAKIIEIGAGFSTRLAAQAILKNKAKDNSICKLVSIEPHPDPILKQGFPGLSHLITKKVEEVPIDEFLSLLANDILFIDSSHVLKTGGDVEYIYLEILPRLNKGVIIHVHDIFFPLEYPREWVVENNFFWTEQYLLQAFLMFNSTFKVLWCGSYMHTEYPGELQKAFRSYNPETSSPKSFWMKKVL